MTMDDRTRWNARWDAPCGAAEPARAPEILEVHGDLLPTAGDALEIACGLGGGALWLADRGLTTRAWDVSPVALGRLGEEARRRGLTVQAEERDVVARPPTPDSVDVLLVVRFLDRSILPALRAAVRPGGLLLLQTFFGPRIAMGPRRPEWRLGPGELEAIAAGFEVLVCTEGPGEEATLVARRQRQPSVIHPLQQQLS